MLEDPDEFENRLRNRPAAEPSADLRSRVLNAVATELIASKRTSTSRRLDPFYWAAAALIVTSLSMMSALQDEFSIWPSHSPNQLSMEFQALGQLEQQGPFK